MRGVARGYHTMARAWSLFCLSLVLIGALCLLNASYGAPDHDPILVMRLLRPILVKMTFTFIRVIKLTTSAFNSVRPWSLGQRVYLGKVQSPMATNI